MSIYIDPEEYYVPQEPSKLSSDTESYLQLVLMASDWFQQDIYEVAPEDMEIESGADGFKYKMNFDRDDIEGSLW